MAPPSLQDKLTGFSTSLYKRADFLSCCDSIFKADEEESSKKHTAATGGVKVSFDANAPISAVNVSKNILE